jgi:hypothetical protein
MRKDNSYDMNAYRQFLVRNPREDAAFVMEKGVREFEDVKEFSSCENLTSETILRNFIIKLAFIKCFRPSQLGSEI